MQASVPVACTQKTVLLRPRLGRGLSASGDADLRVWTLVSLFGMRGSSLP